MNEDLKKRLLSLSWRIGGMVVAVGLTFLMENATELNIPTWGTVLLGLINGEVTKWLNQA